MQPKTAYRRVAGSCHLGGIIMPAQKHRKSYKSASKRLCEKLIKQGRQQMWCPLCCLPMKKTIAYYEKDFNLPQICSGTPEAPRRQPRQSVAGYNDEDS